MAESPEGPAGPKQSRGPTAEARPAPSPMGLSFDPERSVAPTKDASTVLLLREVGGAVEVFCVQRSLRSGFMGGAVVFPGGKVDVADGEEPVRQRSRGELHPRLLEMANDADHAFALAIAAARETLEEAGVLVGDASASTVLRMRQLVNDEKKGFAEALQSVGAEVDIGRLVPFARWVTPEAEPRRFDARFFVIELPHGQEASCCQTETIQEFWARPTDILARFMRGEIQLAPPTTRCLELLAAATSVQAAIDLAASQSLRPVCPRFVPGDPPALALPGDPGHEVKERRVEGPTRFVLRDGRFVSSDP